MAFFSMALAVFGYLIYHISQKYLNHGLNPMWVTAVGYTLAAGISWILFFLFKNLQTSKLEMGWPIIGIGISVVLLDIGFILAYRSGWGISVAPVFANVSVALVLIPLGIFWFHESLTSIQGLGLICCLVGLALLKFF